MYSLASTFSEIRKPFLSSTTIWLAQVFSFLSLPKTRLMCLLNLRKGQTLFAGLELRLLELKILLCVLHLRPQYNFQNASINSPYNTELYFICSTYHHPVCQLWTPCHTMQTSIFIFFVISLVIYLFTWLRLKLIKRQLLSFFPFCLCVTYLFWMPSINRG